MIHKHDSETRDLLHRINEFGNHNRGTLNVISATAAGLILVGVLWRAVTD